MAGAVVKFPGDAATFALLGQDHAADIARAQTQLGGARGFGALQALHHAVEGVGQFADLVVRPMGHAPGQVALGDVMGRGHQAQERARQHPGEQERSRKADGDHDQGDGHQLPGDGAHGGLDIGAGQGHVQPRAAVRHRDHNFDQCGRNARGNVVMLMDEHIVRAGRGRVAGGWHRARSPENRATGAVFHENVGDQRVVAARRVMRLPPQQIRVQRLRIVQQLHAFDFMRDRVADGNSLRR